MFRLTALEVASAVAGVGFGGFVAKTYFDARDALWKRAQWAMDKASSSESDLERKVGLAVMTELLREKRLKTKDVKVMKTVMVTIAAEARREIAATPPARPDLSAVELDTEESGT